MNHIYKTVWNAVKSLWVCVNENTRAHTTHSSRRVRSQKRTGVSSTPSFTLPSLPRRLIVSLGCALGLLAQTNVAQAELVFDRTTEFDSSTIVTTYGGIYKRGSWTGTRLSGSSALSWPFFYAHTHWPKAESLQKDQNDIFTAAVLLSGKTLGYQGRIASMGGELDYAMSLMNSSNLTLYRTVLEGDAWIFQSGLILNDLAPVGDSPAATRLYGNVALTESYLTFNSFLGEVYRSDTAPVATLPTSTWTVSSRGGSNVLHLRAPEATSVLDLDALAQLAGNGQETLAFNEVTTVNTVNVINPSAKGSLAKLRLESGNAFSTLALQSDRTNRPASLAVYANGLVSMDAGETVDLTRSYYSTGTTNGISDGVTLLLDRNTVVLGDNFASFVSTDAQASANATYSIALTDPTRLFATDTPAWLVGKNKASLTLATVVDTTLEAANLNTLGGLRVRAGATTVTGEVTKPIMVDRWGTLRLGDGASVSSLTVNNGTLELTGGNVTIGALRSANATVRVMSDTVSATIPQEESFTTLVTNVSDKTKLQSYMRTFKPKTLYTLAPVSTEGLPAEALSPTMTWQAGADSTVNAYPSQVKVDPGKTVTLNGSGTDNLQLTNWGTVTINGGNFTDRFNYITAPDAPESAHVSITDTTLALLALDPTKIFQGTAAFTVAHLGQVNLNSGTNFTTVDGGQLDGKHTLNINAKRLGSTPPGWWTAQWFRDRQAQAGNVKLDTLAANELAWLEASGVFPLALDVGTATLTHLPTIRAGYSGAQMRFNRLSFTETSRLLTPTTITNTLSFGDGATLTLDKPLTLVAGGRLELGTGSTLVLNGQAFTIDTTGITDPTVNQLTLSVPGTALTGDTAPETFLTPEQKAVTQLETRGAITNPQLATLSPYASWVMAGNVSGLTGTLVKPTTVSEGATLTASNLAVQTLLDIYGTADIHGLTLGASDGPYGDLARSYAVVHAGATLALHEALTLNQTQSTALNVLSEGVLQAPASLLTADNKVLVNYVIGANDSAHVQRGIWEPRFTEDHTHDLTSPLNQTLTNRFETVRVVSGETVTLKGAQSAQLDVQAGGTLKTTGTTTVQNAVTVATSGALKVAGTLALESDNADAAWLARLTLAQGSSVTLEDGASIRLGAGSLVSDATVLSTTTQGAPSWWSAIATSVANDSNKATLVTTGNAQTVNAQDFKRWEVRGAGDTIAEQLAQTTVVYYGKSLTLKQDTLASGSIDNYGTLKFDALTIDNTGGSRIHGGGKVEKIGTGTAIMQGAMDYAGHTTVESGMLKWRKGTSLTGNLTVKSGATLYASLEAPVSARVARAVTETDLSPTASSNSLTLVSGSIFAIDALTATDYTRYHVNANVDIGDNVKLLVHLGDAMSSLTTDTLLRNVLTWGESLNGRFLAATSSTGTADLVFEDPNNETIDLQAVYDLPNKAMHLKVVANTQTPPETGNNQGGGDEGSSGGGTGGDESSGGGTGGGEDAGGGTGGGEDSGGGTGGGEGSGGGTGSGEGSGGGTGGGEGSSGGTSGSEGSSGGTSGSEGSGTGTGGGEGGSSGDDGDSGTGSEGDNSGDGNTDNGTTNTPTEQPTTPQRAGEQPLMGGAAKLALAEMLESSQRSLLGREVSCTDQGPTLWASLLGARGKLNRDGNALGYSSDHAGVAAGSEACVNQSRVGMMLTAAQTEADTKVDGVKHDLKADSWMLSLYGEHPLTDTVTLDAQVGVGRARLKGERQFTDEGLVAKSRTHAMLYQAGAGLNWALTETVTPFARLDYSRVAVKGFTETGADAHNQRVGRDTYEALIARVGAEVRAPLTTQLAWRARASVGVDLLNRSSTTEASFVDGSGTMRVTNEARSRVVGDLAVGLSYQLTPMWDLSGSLAGQIRSGQRSGALEVRSTWTF